jgi:hypothetical protein
VSPQLQALFFRAGKEPGCSLRQLPALSLLTPRHPCCQKNGVTYDFTIIAYCRCCYQKGGRLQSVRSSRCASSLDFRALSAAIWPALRMLPRYVVGTFGAHTHEHGVGDGKRDLTGTHGLYRTARHMITHCCRPSRREIFPSQTGLSIFKARSVAARPRPSHVTLCLFPTTGLNLGVEGTRQGVPLPSLSQQRSTTPFAAHAPKPA